MLFLRNSLIVFDCKRFRLRRRVRHAVAFRRADLLEIVCSGFQIVGSYSAVDVSSIILLLSHAVFVQLEHGAFDRRTIVVLEYDLKDALGFLRIAVQFNRDIRTVFLIA